MNAILRLSLTGSLLLVVLTAAGCGGKSEDLPETVAVSGVVTYQGKPVPEATIMLYPVQGRKPASGRTDEEGRFSLTTFSQDDGALPGEHQVTVNAFQSTDEGVSMKSSIPTKYSTPGSSPLKVTVSEEQPELKLELTD